jgi:hypothetical protein
VQGERCGRLFRPRPRAGGGGPLLRGARRDHQQLPGRSTGPSRLHDQDAPGAGVFWESAGCCHGIWRPSVREVVPRQVDSTTGGLPQRVVTVPNNVPGHHI